MCSPNFSNSCNWNQSFWAVLRPLGMVQSVSLGSGCPRRFGPGLLKPSRKYVTIWEWQNSSKQLQIKDIIRRPAGVSCGSCFFVVVLSVLSVFLSRLSPWRGFLPRLTWTPALLPPPHLALLRFAFIFPYVVAGSTLPTPRSTPLGLSWFCTSCCHFDGCFLVFGCVCHRFAPSLLISSTLTTGITFLNIAFSNAFSNVAFSKTLVDTCFGLNLNRGLNKTNVLRPNPLLHKELFYTKTVLSTNTMLYTKTMLLPGLCKGCLQLTGEFFPWWPAEHAEGS